MPNHPFDRYAQFTDLKGLKDFSARPLRKSMRVNTLKTSVEAFQGYAKENGWTIQPVPWCPEGFFVDRPSKNAEGQEREALGKDLWHLLGHTYIQEAASMLPVALLDPQPGDTVLDMSSAPGSKSTQIAAIMQQKGVLICNDVQEKRIWTLKSSLNRCGVINAIVTKKVGQWFAKQMTERFDRVLCDAPCTAQGTSRKDSDALEYCSLENIGKMARLQRELLESAVHACKVGGTIVYSTCTLSPEENEEVIRSIMNKFSDQLECLHPGIPAIQKAIDDSAIVQKSLGFDHIFPCVRLWPQTLDTEGFFSTVIRKKAPTRHAEYVPSVPYVEEELPESRVKMFVNELEHRYGTRFLNSEHRLFQRGNQLQLSTRDVAKFQLPVRDYAIALPFARRLEDDRIRLDHDFASLYGIQAKKGIVDIDEATLNLLLDGKDAATSSTERGDIFLRYKGLCVGTVLAKEGHLKNRLPRWMIQKS